MKTALIVGAALLFSRLFLGLSFEPHLEAPIIHVSITPADPPRTVWGRR